jgi:transcriptional regulator with XRE-family HTH domain
LDAYENDPDFLTDLALLDITEQIAMRMQQRGVRAAELAQRLGVSRAYVSQMLSGRPNMTVRTLVGVAHALGDRVRVEFHSANIPDEFDPALYNQEVPARKPEPKNDVAAAA